MSGFGTQDAREILFVGHRQDALDEIKTALSGQESTYRVDWLARPSLAPTRVAEKTPDIILVDDDLGGPDPVRLIRQLMLRAPGVTILAMVGENSVSVASQAVIAGARGFVARPIKPDDLITTLRLALDTQPAAAGSVRRSESSRGRVVVFCSSRGGSGLTTLATNTAVALASREHAEVALVDADLGSPAVDVALNLQGRHDLRDLQSAGSDLDTTIIREVLTTHVSGVRALLAPTLNEAFDLPEPADVREITRYLRDMYPWVFVDLGLPQDDLALAYLDEADRIVVNILPEMVGLRNARHLIEIMLDRGYPADRIWLVVSRAPAEGAIHRQDIERRLQAPVVYQVPNDYPLALHSLNRGVPLVVSHPKSALGRALRTFAGEIAGDGGRELRASPEAKADRGWLGRLLKRAQSKIAGPTEDAGLTGDAGQREGDIARAPGQAVDLDAVAAQSHQQEALRSVPQPVSAADEMGQSGVDLTDSLLVEACPHLGLANDPDARFPYPCTANHCCSGGTFVPVDPAHQASTCFGGNWTRCPRFAECLARSAECDQATAAEEPVEASEGAAEEAATIVQSEAQSPELESQTADQDGAGSQMRSCPDDLSGSFVLQACPFLGMRDDDAARLPYPDPDNCCYAQGDPREVDVSFQCSTCFLGDWDRCPRYNAGLEDSFVMGPEESVAGQEPVTARERDAYEPAALAADASRDDDHHEEDSENSVPQSDSPVSLLQDAAPEWIAESDDQALNEPELQDQQRAVPASQEDARAEGDNGLVPDVAAGDLQDSSYGDDERTGAWEPAVAADEAEHTDRGADLSTSDEASDGDDWLEPGVITVDGEVEASESQESADEAEDQGIPADFEQYPDPTSICDHSCTEDADDTLGEGIDRIWTSDPADYQGDTVETESPDEWPDPSHARPEAVVDSALPDDKESWGSDTDGDLKDGLPTEPRNHHDADLFGGLSDGCPYLGLLNDPTSRHPFPDMANYCHAQGTPFSLLPSYQLSYCLGPAWRECARWQKAEKGGGEGWSGVPIPRDMGIPREILDREIEPEIEDESLQLGAVMPNLANAAVPDVDTTSADAPSEPVVPSQPPVEPEIVPTEPATEGTPVTETPAQQGSMVSLTEEQAAAASVRVTDAAPAEPADAAPAEPDEPYQPEEQADGRCPFLGLARDPDSYIATPGQSNYCHALGEPGVVALSYQAGTCLKCSWELCPRFVASRSADSQSAASQSADSQSAASQDPAATPGVPALPAEREESGPVAPQTVPDEGESHDATVAVQSESEGVPEEYDAQASVSEQREDRSWTDESGAESGQIAPQCPYLGSVEAIGECEAEPSECNHCHARRVPFSVMPSYQSRVCLTDRWESCPRYLSRQSEPDEPDDYMDEVEAEPAKAGIGRWVRSLIGL